MASRDSTSAGHVRAARRGLSLVDSLIGLAICSGLLTAVGAAMQTSFNVVRTNDDFTRATQASRVTLTQVLTEVRRATGVQVSADGRQLDIIRVPAERLPNEVYRRYSYDASGSRVTLQVFYAGGTTSPVYTLASNVDFASFGPATMSPDSSVVVRVPVVIKAKIGATVVVLNGAAAPRQAIKY